MDIKTIGKFTKTNGHIYRTETYIQIGSSDKIIGACVLASPGSSCLNDPIAQKELDEFTGEQMIIVGEIKEDPTMKQLVKLLTEALGEEIEGKFHLLNLFTVRSNNTNESIELLQSITNEPLLHKDFRDFKMMDKDLPFVLLGWGCERNRSINELKREWLTYLSDNELQYVGHKHKDAPHYYHPMPRIIKKQREYIDLVSPEIGQTRTRMPVLA